MRSYIFTPLERQLLHAWIDGKITLKDIRLKKLLWRIRKFTGVAEDVNLYVTVKSRLTEPKTTTSA
jgi:hypothetical protein